MFSEFHLSKGFAHILKWNPHHYGAGEHGGQFESSEEYGDFEKLTPPKPPKQYKTDPKDLNKVFTQFKKDGCVLDEPPEEMAKRWKELVPNVHPHEFFRAFLGDKDFNDKNMNHMFLSLSTEDKQIKFASTGSGVTVHGVPAKDYERMIDIGNHGVEHTRLELDKASQGGGLVKKLFKSCVPLYGKMGLSHITLYANLDRGAYAWGKYGFKYHDEEGSNENKEKHQKEVTKRLNALVALKVTMTPEAKKEVNAITKVLKSKSDDTIWALTDMKTPHLDKLYATTIKKDSNKSNFIKLLVKNTNWPGVMDIQKGAPSRARLDQYLGAKDV